MVIVLHYPWGGSRTTLPLARSGSRTTLPLARSGSRTTLPLARGGSRTTLPLARGGSRTTLPLARDGSRTTLPLARSGSRTTLPLARVGSRTTLPLARGGSRTTLPLARGGSRTTLPLARVVVELHYPWPGVVVELHYPWPGVVVELHYPWPGVVVELHYPWQINLLKRGTLSFSHDMCEFRLNHSYFVPLPVLVDVFLGTTGLSARGIASVTRLSLAFVNSPRRASGLSVSVIQAPRCGATVCRIHHRLDAKCAFHCDRNYVCTQILRPYIISQLRCHPGIWLIHKIRVNFYLFIRCNSN